MHDDKYCRHMAGSGFEPSLYRSSPRLGSVSAGCRPLPGRGGHGLSLCGRIGVGEPLSDLCQLCVRRRLLAAGSSVQGSEGFLMLLILGVLALELLSYLGAPMGVMLGTVVVNGDQFASYALALGASVICVVLAWDSYAMFPSGRRRVVNNVCWMASCGLVLSHLYRLSAHGRVGCGVLGDGRSRTAGCRIAVRVSLHPSAPRNPPDAGPMRRDSVLAALLPTRRLYISWTPRALRTRTPPGTRAMTQEGRYPESGVMSRWTRRDCPCDTRDYHRRYRPGRGPGEVLLKPARPQPCPEGAGGRGLHREALCHCGAKLVGSRGGSTETHRTTHLHGTSKAMGGGAVFRLTGKVPPTLEQL